MSARPANTRVMTTSQHDESLHPREATGKFATKPVTEASGGMDALAAPSPDLVTVPIAAGEAGIFVLNLAELPEWPSDVSAPDASYSWNSVGQVEVCLQVDSEPITFWGDNGDVDSEFGDRVDLTADQIDQIHEYGKILHGNLDDVAGQYREASEGADANAALMAIASGKQPVPAQAVGADPSALGGPNDQSAFERLAAAHQGGKLTRDEQAAAMEEALELIGALLGRDVPGE